MTKNAPNAWNGRNLRQFTEKKIRESLNYRNLPVTLIGSSSSTCGIVNSYSV
jgi:hypothetical protein